MRSIKSPFLMNLLHEFSEGDHHFIVTKFCPGGDLFNWIHQVRAIEEDEARIQIACIVLALEELHQQRYIHRDVKPENILVDSEGYCILSDFGISG